MIRIGETPVLWIWRDETTGICFPETMYATEDYARTQAERILGKRRLQYGEMVAVRVSLAPLSPEETEGHRREFAAWKERKHQSRQVASVDLAGASRSDGQEVPAPPSDVPGG